VELETAGATSSSAPLRLSPVEVDLAELDDFRSFVSRELDANLRPSADTIAVDHRRGVAFGDRHAGTSVQTARFRYQESLATAVANLSAYLDTAEVLIAAIRRIGRDYRDVDLASAAGSAAVNRELTTAMVVASQTRINALAAARERAWRLKSERLVTDVGPGE
jgi:hypothetical protein